MPVNVAFGPSAGIGGALSFGTGARKYSDRKAQVEQQSKRQMLSDAMGFAKFLQESRRPAEQHQRNLARMEKSKEIAQSNATHAQRLAQDSAIWERNQKQKNQKELMETLQGERSKVDEKAKEMLAKRDSQGNPEFTPDHVNKWRVNAHGMVDASVLGRKPPRAVNPYEAAAVFEGRTILPNERGEFLPSGDITSARKREELEQAKYQHDVHRTAVSETTDLHNRVSRAADDRRKLLLEETKDFEASFAESKLEEKVEPGEDGTGGSKGWGVGHTRWPEYRTGKARLQAKARAIDEWEDRQTEQGIAEIWSPLVGSEGVSGTRAEQQLKFYSDRADSRRQERDFDRIPELFGGDPGNLMETLTEAGASEEEIESVSRWRPAGGGGQVPVESSGIPMNEAMYNHILENPHGTVANRAVRSGLISRGEIGVRVAERQDSMPEEATVYGKKIKGPHGKMAVVKEVGEVLEKWDNTIMELEKRSGGNLPSSVKLVEKAKKARKMQLTRLEQMKTGNAEDPWEVGGEAKTEKYDEAKKEFTDELAIWKGAEDRKKKEPGFGGAMATEEQLRKFREGRTHSPEPEAPYSGRATTRDWGLGQ